MKPNQFTLERMNVGNPEEQWHVHAVGNCGEKLFKNVVVFVEPLSKNPGVHVPGETFGVLGMIDAIELLKAERAKLGLTTSR